MDAIQSEIHTGDPVQVGDYEIIPQTRVLKIQFPGNHAVLIWNRPKAVIVKTSDGQESTLAVRDITRVIIWSMLAGGLLGAMLIRLMHRN
ncbi:MAG: hypothetical protein A2Y88_06470 [Chloroflexi bacterium RBG_13_48_10]|nr:MAG: hypothetical protein A2Y88_06470 [Chloroflexi bacterium RBG_13_48_10]